jgi:hypothetical protein
MKKIVINKCYGGFGLSDLAYEALIEKGIPIRKYIPEKRGKDGRFKRVPENEGEVIFDRELTPLGEDSFNDIYWQFKNTDSRMNQRYWETWITTMHRTDPRIIKVVEELGKKANGPCADLKIVSIPDDVEFTIEKYDGLEHIAEVHKVWS